MTNAPDVTVIGAAVQVETTKGVTLYVTPLTQRGLEALIRAAVAAFPDPDPTPYEVEVKNSLVPGDKRPATENPAYAQLMAAIEDKRQSYLRDAILSVAVDSPKRLEIIAFYRERVERMRAMLAKDADLWACVLHWYILIDSELSSILAIAQDKAALSEAEIREGVKFFRPALRRATADGDRRRESARDLPANEQRGGIDDHE